jgi:hypothetical protein
LRKSIGARQAGLSVLAVLIGANFILHIVEIAPNYVFRMWQIAILLGYATALLAGLTSLAGFGKALTAWGSIALVLLGAEAVVGGPDDFSPTVGEVGWAGTTTLDSTLGVRFTPSTVAKTLYPANPRNYFDEPNDLQKRWNLLAFEGSKAQLEFTGDNQSVMRVNISDAPGRVTWHIALIQAPIRVLANASYELRFRVRSDAPRTVFTLVGQAHEPWGNLGLVREIRADTSWNAVSLTFRASGSDRNARLYFDLGGDAPSLELSDVSLREISTNKMVESEVPQERSVSYRFNSQGCRETEIPKRDSLERPWRILTIGDGSTMGVGVHQRDTYETRLQSLLNETSSRDSSGVKYEIINCGAWGSSTADQFKIASRTTTAYAPNVVLLSVSPDNFQSSIDEGFPQNGKPLSNFARLFRTWGVVTTSRQPKVPPPDLSPVVEGVRQIAENAQASGAKFVVMMFRNRHGDDWTRLDSALASGLRDLNVPILDLGPTLLPFGEQEIMVDPRFDTHPNALAHRLAAEALRKFLSEQGMLYSRSSQAESVTRVR